MNNLAADQALEYLDQLLETRRKANWFPRVASEVYRVDLTLAREKALADVDAIDPTDRAEALRTMGSIAIEQGLALWIEEARTRGQRVGMSELRDRALAFATRAVAREWQAP